MTNLLMPSDAVCGLSIQMGLHGAPLIYGLFMRPRSAVIEFRPHQFEGEAPDHVTGLAASQWSMLSLVRCIACSAF